MSSAYILLSVWYLLHSIHLIVQSTAMDRALSEGGYSAYYLYRFFPVYLWFPVLYAVASSSFLYCSAKIRDNTPLAFLMAISLTIIVPFGIRYLEINHEISTVANPVLPQMFSPSVLLSGFIFLELIRKRRTFSKTGAPLSKQIRTILFTLTAVFLLPILLRAIIVYYSYSTNDNGYQAAKQRISYYLYKPAILPGDRIYETAYRPCFGVPVSERCTEVRFNFTPKTILATGKNGIIRFLQRPFIKGITEDVHFIDRMNPAVNPQTPDKPAWIAQNNGETRLEWVSPHNTLLTIIAYNTSTEEIYSLAQSLR